MKRGNSSIKHITCTLYKQYYFFIIIYRLSDRRGHLISETNLWCALDVVQPAYTVHLLKLLDNLLKNL